MEVMENPWNVTSLEDFRYYNCPECEDKYVAKEQSVCHATTVHAKAREALPGILQVENEIVISNVRSIVEYESIEKVEPMSDVEIDENIELPTNICDNDEEDLSEYEKLRLKNIAERQAKFNALKISDKVLDLSRNNEMSKRNVSSRDLSAVLKEKDKNSNTSDIEPSAATTNTGESIEPVLIKISKKDNSLADQQLKNRKRTVKSVRKINLLKHQRNNACPTKKPNSANQPADAASTYLGRYDSVSADKYNEFLKELGIENLYFKAATDPKKLQVRVVSY